MVQQTWGIRRQILIQHFLHTLPWCTPCHDALVLLVHVLPEGWNPHFWCEICSNNMIMEGFILKYEASSGKLYLHVDSSMIHVKHWGPRTLSSWIHQWPDFPYPFGTKECSTVCIDGWKEKQDVKKIYDYDAMLTSNLVPHISVWDRWYAGSSGWISICQYHGHFSKKLSA